MTSLRTKAASACALGLVLAACSSGSHHSSAPASTTPPAASTTAPAHGTTTTPTSTTGAPTGGPVPAGFQAVSFTAVSDDDYWVLGTAPCHNPVCTSIVRTTDGGAHFAGIPAPPIPVSASGSAQEPELRFADPLDGFAFLPRSGVLYVTHDGGANWHPVHVGTLFGFATGGGYGFVVSGSCSAGGACGNYQLLRSPVSSDSWTGIPMPFAPAAGTSVDIAAHGAYLWLLGDRASAQSATNVVARSSDSGASFSTVKGPCVPGLPGKLEPASSTAVWATCPTGMMAAVYRSTHGGASFHPVSSPEVANAAQLAPASDHAAILLTETGSGSVLRTVDGGATWATVAGHVDWTWIGFTDATTGAAVAHSGSGWALWRTTDGGSTWHPVVF